jgi:1,4-alpha-glucan branching enzyme
MDAIIGASHGDPFRVLGQHATSSGWIIRVSHAEAKSVTILDLDHPGVSIEAERVHPKGIFEAVVSAPIAYEIRYGFADGSEFVTRDPYSFDTVLGEMDLHLIGEGTHWRLYDRLGAHLTTVDGVSGVHFAVWAPNAVRVSVVGDFNQWDGRRHMMRLHPGVGVWEIFVPGIAEGAHYKFEIRAKSGDILVKTDPMAFYAQHGTKTAAMVFNLDRYAWADETWMDDRKHKEWHRRPVSVYEVHLGSWRLIPEEGNRPLSYLELADELVPYVKEMGYTHVELMPVAEHPFDGSWGYQITGYFAPTSRFGNPDEFRHFVDRCHQAGIGVIVDWVPGHFPKDAHGLARFDGTALYEHADPRQGEHRDWGTLIFNYGRNEVCNFLISNALFWMEHYHIDGLRVDAVASMLYLDYSREAGDWIPNEHGGRENLAAISFMKRCNEICYERFPGIMTIAEESTAWPMVSRPTYLGGLGFGFKWNMGWMNDSLFYMSRDPVYRKFHQGTITFSLLYAFHEHFILVLSHDEVVHGKGSLIKKMPGDDWQKFANLRMFYAWMYGHPGKKLLFMGGEFGQWDEWRHDKSLDWHLAKYPMHDGLQRLVQHLNWLLKSEPALYDQDDNPEGFEWIDFQDSEGSVVSFIRRARNGQFLVFAVNATPVPRYEYRIGVPNEGYYAEVLNSDAQTYGGANIGNYGGRWADDEPAHGRPFSLSIALPPLSTIAFKLTAMANIAG